MKRTRRIAEIARGTVALVVLTSIALTLLPHSANANNACLDAFHPVESPPAFNDTPVSRPTRGAYARAAGRLLITDTKTLRDTFKQAADAKEYQARKTAFEAEQKRIKEVRDGLVTQVSKMATNTFLPTQQAGALRSKEATLALLNRTYNDKVMAVAVERLRQDFRKLAEDKQTIDQTFKATQSQLEALVHRAPTRRMKDLFQGISKLTLSRMRASANPAEVTRLSHRGVRLATGIVTSYEKALHKQRVRELRLNPKDPATTQKLVESLLNVIEGVSSKFRETTTTLRGRSQDLTQILNKDAVSLETRVYLYRELQFLRRVTLMGSDSANGKRTEFAVQRARNTLLALQSVFHGERKLVTLVMARESLEKARAAKSDVAPLHKLSRLEREQVINEALTSAELLASLIGANLKASYPKLPVAPIAPSLIPPPKPDFSMRRKSLSEARRVAGLARKFKADVRAFKQTVDAYVEAVKAYKAEVLKFPAEVARVTEINQRRQQHEQNLAAYLVYRYPHLFSSQAEVATRRAQYESARLQREAQLARLGLNTRPQIRYTYSSSDPSFLDWYYFYYTQDPYWLANRNIALSRLILDAYYCETDSYAQRAGGALGLDPAVVDPRVAQSLQDKFNLENPALVQEVNQLPPLNVAPMTTDPSANAPTNADRTGEWSPEQSGMAESQAAQDAALQTEMRNWMETGAREAEDRARRAEQFEEEAARSLREAEGAAAAAESALAGANLDRILAEAERAAHEAEQAATAAEQQATLAEREANDIERAASAVESAAETAAAATEISSNNDSPSSPSSD